MTAPLLNAAIQGQGTISADNLNTYIQNCTNIAQLRSFVGLPGMCVFIDGSVVQGDGGAGPFYWNTTSTGPDNDSTVIVPQSGVPGAWVRLAISQTSPINLANIAALEAFQGGSIAPVVYVEGYYTAADGGGGLYVYISTDTTSPSNGGTIIIDGQNNRYYLETGGLPISVKSFGAVGNGVTNDSEAIQACLNAIGDSGGGIVYLTPTGAAYLINTGLNLPGGVTFYGASSRNFPGTEGTISQWTSEGSWIHSTDTSNSAITVVGHGATISGINFIYTQPIPGVTFTPNFYPYSISFSSGGGDFVNIENILIIAASHGISINYTSENGGGTGVNIRNILISSFVRGFLTYAVNDTICIDNLHVRNMYYNTTASVVSYTENNLVAWDCQYCDNPMIKGIEFFQCLIGILLTDVTVLGITHSLYNGLIDALQFNLVNQAISFGNLNGTAKGRFSNCLAQQDTGNGFSTTLFALSSDNGNFTFSNMVIADSGGQVFDIGNGSGGTLVLGDLVVLRYSAISPNSTCIVANEGSSLVLGNRQITKSGSAGSTIGGSGTDQINTPHNWQWSPYSAENQYNMTGTGSFVNFSLSNSFNPIKSYKLQGRITGNVNITTPESGSGTIKLENFNEITASFSTSSTGLVSFDSGWIDLSSGSNIIGTIQISSPSGAVIQNNNMTVMLR